MQRQYALDEFCLQASVVDGAAESKHQLIVTLGTFQVERLPIDAHQVSLAGRDDQVWASASDFHPGGIYAGHINGEFHGLGMLRTVVMRLAERLLFGSTPGKTATAAVGFQRVDDRMHGKRGCGLGSVGTAGLIQSLMVSDSRILDLRARCGFGLFIPVHRRRAHVDTALLTACLRKRSACVAVNMLEGLGHDVGTGERVISFQQSSRQAQNSFGENTVGAKISKKEEYRCVLALELPLR